MEGMTSDSVLMILPLGGSFSVNTSKVEVSVSGLSSGGPDGSRGAGVLCCVERSRKHQTQKRLPCLSCHVP